MFILVSYIVKTVVLIKSENVKQHRETKDRSFEDIYQQKSEVRVHKITELRGDDYI